MKVIIAGSRGISNKKILEEAIKESGFEITELVNGKCKSGIDHIAYRWAMENKIPIKEFPADWQKFGLSGGPIRNLEMGKYADCLIAIWDKQSKGTKDMITKMKILKKPVYIKKVNP